MAALTKEQSEAYGLIKELKALYKQHVDSGRDWLTTAIQIGGVLNRMKKLLPHGEFLPFIEQHFDFSDDSAKRYMKAADAVKKIPPTMRAEDFSIKELIRIGSANDTPKNRIVRNLKSASDDEETTSENRPAPIYVHLGEKPPQSDDPIGDACQHVWDDDGDCLKCKMPRPKIKGGTSFDVAEIEAAAGQTFAQRVQAHNLGIERLARAVAESIKELPESHELEKKQTVVEQQIQSVCGTIRTCKIHDKPCPKCEDNGKPCKVCGGCGMVTKMTYDGMGGK